MEIPLMTPFLFSFVCFSRRLQNIFTAGFRIKAMREPMMNGIRTFKTFLIQAMVCSRDMMALKITAAMATTAIT